LLLAKTRAREVTVGDESNDIRHHLVLAQDGIDDDRNKGGQEGLTSDLYHDHNQSTSLEDSTKKIEC
jgi:hypothetical protein